MERIPNLTASLMSGFVVFVKNGKVGNKVKVKVTEVADRFAKAIITG